MQKYPDDLTDLCYPISTCESAGIFAICLQEVSPDKNELLIRLQATLGPRHVLFSYAFQGTLGLLIFLSRDLIWYTSVPQSTGITTRANIRTKGAVAICFILFGTSLLFVSSHFKANPGNLDLRINDYKEVVRSLNLPKVGLERGYRQKNTSVLDRFDAVFWAGDLNFRLRKTRRQVENMLRTERKSSAFEHLLNFDELVSTQLKGQIFQQFEEGRIRFPPTYKYDINSDDFDTSEKCRVPAYTDRILYRVQKKGTVNCVHYDSVRTIRSSDHRPVYGYYTVCLKPGCDNIALAAGAFHRDIYIAASVFGTHEPKPTSTKAQFYQLLREDLQPSSGVDYRLVATVSAYRTVELNFYNNSVVGICSAGRTPVTQLKRVSETMPVGFQSPAVSS
ncbi:phosphatidylinositol-bisphosphatase [Clonorchis sinensis]|uniref:Phosphatidylinositol-bisphosphatase n=1 Tax=Clonorchis sinensis TaxID=79923 RepID=H2KTM6_CLOSI|nr:phosphatidylinositol-bisphosphatase [Clonorchis sinensis]